MLRVNQLIGFGGFGGGGNDAFTKILLHFDGADASTTITDDNRGGSAHTWTANGNAQLDNGVAPKFGSAALLCDGSSDWVSTGDSADFTLGSGAFTVDFWFNRSGGDGTRRFAYGQANSAAADFNMGVELTAANVVRAVISQDGTTQNAVVGTTTFTAAGWHHVAFVRTGNTLKLFVDGVQEGGDVSFTLSALDSGSTFSVGRFGAYTGGLDWFGSIDEFRLSVGIARWTANFTPPTEAYS